MSRKMKNIISFIVIGIVLIFIFIPKGNSYKHVPYQEFLDKVEGGEVAVVYFNVYDGAISFEDVDGKRFASDNPRVDGFKMSLLEKDIRVIDTTANITQSNFAMDVLRIAMYIGGIYLITKLAMKQMTKNTSTQKIMKVGKADEVPDVTFNDVIINEEIKDDILTVVDYLKNPKKYKDVGITLPKGIIFYGPPGTGKTLMAKAIAGEAGVPFIYANGSDFMQMYVGMGALRIRELFKEARKNSPSIVFIDEIDAVGTKRGGDFSHGEKDQTINALLSELDGFKSNDNIVVIVATNRIKDLDDALIRPGRFDKHIAIPLPELEERREILKIYLDKKNINKDIDEGNWAKMTTGFSGASIATLINEGALNAVKFQKSSITDEDMYDAYYKMILKGHKKKNKRRDEELRIVAYHEAGHALVTKLLTKKSVPKVSIISNTAGAGGVTFVTEDNINLLSKTDLINEVKILYGGNVAEEILLGHKEETTTGASNDIERATFILKSLITTFGMGKFGLINADVFKLDQREVLNECVNLSEVAREETLALLLDNKDKLEKIAEKLLEKENIDEQELDVILNSSC